MQEKRIDGEGSYKSVIDEEGCTSGLPMFLPIEGHSGLRGELCPVSEHSPRARFVPKNDVLRRLLPSKVARQRRVKRSRGLDITH